MNIKYNIDDSPPASLDLRAKSDKPTINPNQNPQTDTEPKPKPKPMHNQGDAHKSDDKQKPDQNKS